MTDQDLEALAIYRTHKNCSCRACQIARILLKQRDETGHWGSTSTCLPEEEGARVDQVG